MKRLYLTHITEHATHRFSERYEKKTGEKVTNKQHAHKLIFDVFNEFVNDETSYIELIENIENFKDRHIKYAEKRKQKDDTHKILYKNLQLVFVFDKDFKHLLTCRIDTGKFKRRRTQHKPLLEFT